MNIHDTETKEPITIGKSKYENMGVVMVKVEELQAKSVETVFNSKDLSILKE